MTESNIQLFIMAEDAVLVEGDAPVAGKIGLDVRSDGDAVVQIDQALNFALEGLHAIRKGITQPLDDLEQRKIGVGHPAAGEIEAAVVLQQPLEITEIFRHPLLPEFLGAPLRR